MKNKTVVKPIVAMIVVYQVFPVEVKNMEKQVLLKQFVAIAEYATMKYLL